MTKKIETISTIFLSVVIMGIVFMPIPTVIAGNGMIFVDEDGMADADSCDNATGAFSTIQSAIDDANFGDTIVVCPHDTEYAEAVVVDKPGITIEGIEKPKVNGGENSPAFNIISDGVVLSGFEATSNDSSCIEVTASNTKIVGNIASDCDDSGIIVFGNGNLINANKANGNENNIQVIGNDNKIRANTANDGNDEGLRVFGNNNTIMGNTVNGNDFGGIRCNCDNSVIQGNTVNDNGSEGLDLDGTNITIRSNTANNNDREGMVCDNCDDSVIRGNTFNENGEDGIELSNDALDTTVSHNTTNDNGEFGIDNDGTNNTFDKNRCRNNIDGGSDPAELCAPQG